MALQHAVHFQRSALIVWCANLAMGSVVRNCTAVLHLTEVTVFFFLAASPSPYSSSTAFGMENCNRR